MISFYERNERIPPIDIIVKLSEIFSVSTDYLLGLSPEQSMPNTQNSLSIEEKKIINIYRSLDKDYKDIILGELKKMEKLQKLEYRSKATKKEA